MRRAFRLESNITSRPEERLSLHPVCGLQGGFLSYKQMSIMYSFLIEATSTLAFIIAVSQDSLKRSLDIREGYLFFVFCFLFLLPLSPT